MGDQLHDEWHRTAAEELEGRVKNRDFFVVLRVEPEQGEPDGGATPKDVDSEGWEAVAADVEEWLGAIDPDSVPKGDPPTHQVRVAGAVIELAPLPKKKTRRGTDPLISNPYTHMAPLSGVYSTGPPTSFDDGT